MDLSALNTEQIARLLLAKASEMGDEAMSIHTARLLASVADGGDKKLLNDEEIAVMAARGEELLNICDSLIAAGRKSDNL